MSNSKLICYTKLSPHTYGRRTHKIDTITVHCMAGNMYIESCGELFQTREASSNYGIGSDGRIALYANEDTATWATSDYNNDNRSITIEVADDGSVEHRITDKAYNALIKLCADICKRNDIKKLIWSDSKEDRVNHINGCNMTVHRDYANKSCPGDYIYKRLGKIASEVNALLNPLPKLDTKGFKKNSKSLGVLALNQLLQVAYKKRIVTTEVNQNNRFGAKTKKAVNQLLKKWGYKQNGIAGEKFIKKLGKTLKISK